MTTDQIQNALLDLSGWVYDGSSIKKVFKMRNYPSTMGFVTAVGGFCQRKNHHPDYILMKFRDVEVSFSTHSAGGVTENDIELAREIDQISV